MHNPIAKTPGLERIFKQLMRFCSAFTVVGPEVARYYAQELGRVFIADACHRQRGRS